MNNHAINQGIQGMRRRLAPGIGRLHIIKRRNMNSLAETRRTRGHWPLPMVLRMVTWLLIFLQLETACPVMGAAMNGTTGPVSAPTPKGPPASAGDIAKSPPAPSLWHNEDEAAIGNFRAFSEPLLPVGKATAAENRDLLDALHQFSARQDGDDYSALQGFLDRHPHSAWKPSLLMNLGTFLRYTGYFTRAMDMWREAWELTKDQSSGTGKIIADRSAAEYVRLNSNFGRCGTMSAMLNVLGKRNLDPAVYQIVVNARDSLVYMHQHPESSFLCGPMALSRILKSEGKYAYPPEIQAAQSTTNGLRLADVLALANQMHMNYQMARRSPGSKIILPAVVHLRSDHFAALVGESHGRYLMQDATSDGADLWVSPAALDDEGSGYCLVPSGPLPSGWKEVAESDGQNVWGRGKTTAVDTKRLRKADLVCGPCVVKGILQLLGLIGMPHYAVHAMMVSLTVEDTPIGYAPVFGPPVTFTVTYLQRESSDPSTFTCPNVGKLWTFNWFSYIQETSPSSGLQTVTRYLPGGGQEEYDPNSAGSAYQTQPESRTQLIKTGSGSTATYELDFPDGSKIFYGKPDGGSGSPHNIFMTQMVDPQGNQLNINWSTSGPLRITSVSDSVPKGSSVETTTIGYLSSVTTSLDYYKISTVTDPFGRVATLTYGPATDTGDRPLLGITDMGGLFSSFSYDSTGFMTSMTTPYGTTKFSTGTDPADSMHEWVVVTDPLGQQERTEARQFNTVGSPIAISDPPAIVPVIPATLPQPANTNLEYRNTFFWNKAVMQQMGGVIDNTSYPKAHIYHWLHAAVAGAVTSGDLESEKDPLENRVWYEYPGQSTVPNNQNFYEGSSSQPEVIARVLDAPSGQAAGPTQLVQIQRNDLGNVIEQIDPIGRTTWFNYNANEVDLKEVRQGGTATTGDLLASYTYDTAYPRRIHTSTDASSQTTTFSYTSHGQLQSVENAKSETTSYVYGDSAHPGFLTEIDGPMTGAKVTFAADSGVPYRTVTTTDSEGYAVNYAYDNFDRVTNITYPDSTTERTIYNKLDAVLVKDRLNQWSAMEYDPLQRLVAAKDSLGRVTKYQYCSCGALESITDPKGQVTTWLHDLQNRVIGKFYADGTTTTTAYENTTSRVKSVTDAKGQTTQFAYNLDDTTSEITYANTQIFTPGVSYTYDPVYNRVLTMADSATGTTTYAYNPVTSSPALGAGRLASLAVDFNGTTTTYGYDELGRVTDQAINSVHATAVYDSLGRITIMTNALGSFTNNYVNQTARLSSVLYPLNHQEEDFTYFPGTDLQNRERLQTLQNKISSSPVNVSKFDYTYDPVGRIATWTRTPDSSASTFYQYQYDRMDQLLTGALTNGTPGSPGSQIEKYTYSYDTTGNRVSEMLDVANTATTSGFNNVNQLFERTNGVRVNFAGSFSQASAITINGVPANTSPPSTGFSGYAAVSGMSNLVSVQAIQPSGAITTIHYQPTNVGSGNAKLLTYDLNGNLISAVTGTAEETYEWNGADRLTAINHRSGSAPGTRSEFTYDGPGRRMRDVEKDATGAVISDKRYVWTGMGLSEELDASNNTNLFKWYFAQGVKIGGNRYFYTRDHLGSIRELIDSSGTIQARYDYDPYGRRTKVSGSMDADFGFTGFFYHAPSSLLLAPYRAYDPDTGRWISRDPIREEGGINLYAYVGDDPVDENDFYGLAGLIQPMPEDGLFIHPEAVNKIMNWIEDRIDDLRTSENPYARGIGAGLWGASWVWGGPECKLPKEAEEGTVFLYRAISEAEAKDIPKNGFRPGPGSLEAKEFATTAKDAAKYGVDNYRFDNKPFFIVEVNVAKSAVDAATQMSLDGKTAIVIPYEQLNSFNTAVNRVEVLSSVPIPKR